MKSGDLVALSVANLGRRKVRTALTLIGIVIGVGALVLMVSLGVGVQSYFNQELSTEGQLRTIFVSRTDLMHKNPFRMQSIQMVSQDDLESMREIPGVKGVVPALNLLLNVYAEVGEKKESAAFEIVGMLFEEQEQYSGDLLCGRIWNDGEKACLLPSAFFPKEGDLLPEEVVGQEVILGKRKKDGESFRVAGIYDTKAMGAAGRKVILPFDVAMALRKETKGGLFPFGYSEEGFMRVEVLAENLQDVSVIKAALEEKGFFTLTMVEFIGLFNRLFLVVEGFLACIGAVGVIVALFGIANTMAMAVMERTREIGILKALGARNAQVRKLFILESLWIGLLGGCVGLLGGWSLGFLLNVLSHLEMIGVPADVQLFKVSAWLALGSLAFAVLVSLVAGTVPAMRASRLDPVQALRYE